MSYEELKRRLHRLYPAIHAAAMKGQMQELDRLLSERAEILAEMSVHEARR